MTSAASHTSTAARAPNRSGGGARSNISIVIPTFNEEINLPHALRSVVDWADAVFVVDSESTDRTRELAQEMGAKVVVQKWLGYARQKNWALENLPLDTDWIFILDADELILPELRDEMLEVARGAVDTVSTVGFYVNRLTHFMGAPIRHCGFFPSYNLRFFKRGRAAYELRDVHEHMLVDGPTSRLRHIMLHEDRRGLEHFIAKHNRYSTLEARELMRAPRRGKGELAEELERGIALRRWLKTKVLPRLPLIGLWRFIYMYVLRLGFLDGATGFRFCLLLSMYDSFISLKLVELRLAGVAQDPSVIEAPVAKGLAIVEGELPAESVGNERESGATGAAAGAPASRPAARTDSKRAAQAPASGSSARATERLASSRVSPALDTTGLTRRLAGSGHSAFCSADLAQGARPAVSVIVLSFNEEDNIRACLESCAWCDDVHVLDSGSTDRTREIAEEMGATVHVNRFESFGQQRNWAIDNIQTKHRWQFQLDADERFTLASVAEMAIRITKDGESMDGVTAYQNPSMLMFMDRWLRFAAEYPVYQVRLFDRTVCRFEDHGHGQREVNPGATGVAVQPYLHYNFSKGIDEWIDKHNRYSERESAQALSEPRLGLRGLLRGLLVSGGMQRRRVLKRISYRLPFRSTLIIFYQMVLRLGVLDGPAGWNYVRLRSIYEAMIAVKLSVRKHERARGSAAKESRS